MTSERRSHSLPSLPTDRRAAIDAFLEKLHTPTTVAPGMRGRLAFALDATGSRERTWDLACQLQAEMFEEVARLGGLDIQLIYYRGRHECRASYWVSDGKTLANLMMKIRCISGQTQIGRVLEHARKVNDEQKLRAVVLVGDCVEEQPADLYVIADELGKRDVPVLVFQEGDDRIATDVFLEIARRTKGAHCHFDPSSANELAELLRAAARYASGGLKALSASQNASAVKLLQQLT
jgi:hypothetical protein